MTVIKVQENYYAIDFFRFRDPWIKFFWDRRNHKNFRTSDEAWKVADSLKNGDKILSQVFFFQKLFSFLISMYFENDN